MKKFLKDTGIFLILALLYFVTGKLGLLMAVPPGYATAVWPPSGFALAGLLIFGGRFWPSIWIGSFFVNIGTTLDLSSFHSAVQSSAPAIIIGLGAALQSLIGNVLIRKYLGNTITLLKESDIFKFLVLGGPVSCLINATIGITTLVNIGAIKLQSAFFSWWTWWVGDSIGVLIFAPIMLIFLANPQEVWRPRKKTVAFPMMVTFALMVVLFVFMKNTEDRRIRDEFNSQSNLIYLSISNQMQRYLDNLYSLRSFFDSSNSVERSEFASFVASAIKREEGIQALEWDPKVTHAQREAFEQSVRAEGFSDFEIKEMAPEKQIIKSLDRDYYFPITYAEPISTNGKVLGFDFMSEKSRQNALKIAWKNGELALTRPIKLIQGPTGVIAFLAVYDNKKISANDQARTENIAGFVVEVLRIENVIKEASSGIPEKNYVLHVSDMDSEEGKMQIFSGNMGKDGQSQDALKFNIKTSHNIRWEQNMSIGGRQWHIETYPTADYFIVKQNWNIWFILAGGLLFIGFLGGFLIVMSGRETEVLGLVDERTRQIKEVNEKLKQEFKQKELLAQSLSTRNKELEDARMVALNIAQDAQIAQQKATEAEERFRMIVEGVTDYAIYLLDPLGNILTWNAGAERFKGYKAQEIIGQHFSKFYLPEDIEINKPQKDLRIAVERGTYKENGWRVRKDGQKFWASVLITALKDSRGTLRGFSKITQDIPEIKRNEEQIRKLSLAVEQNPASIVITNINGLIEYVNHKFTDVTGFSASEAVGKNPKILNSGYQSKEFYTVMWETIKAGREWRGEFHNKKKNGELFWESALISPLKDANGNVTHFVAIKEDITESKAKQEKIALLTNYQKALLDNAGFSIISTDPNGIILQFNPSAERMLGYSAEEMIDRATPAIIHDEKEVIQRAKEFSKELGIDIPPGFEVFVAKSRRNLPNTHEWTYVRKDGTRFPVLLSVTALRNQNGDIFGFLGLASDISEIKDAQNKLVQAMNIKSDFTSMVSHELRTPLTVIKESVAIVYDETAGKINADQREFLETAKRNVDRLGRLINDVLDYQKLDAQRMEFVMEEQDINAVVKEVGNSFKLAFKNKGIGLEMKLQPNLPQVIFDKDRMIQVLTNLISNAMKFTDHGAITLTTEKIIDNAIQVSVKDQGIGIRESDISKLFKSFSQISTGTGRQTGGTGLGLVLCKRIIEHHKGRVGVESVYGQGSTFYFILPIQDRRAAV